MKEVHNPSGIVGSKQHRLFRVLSDKCGLRSRLIALRLALFEDAAVSLYRTVEALRTCILCRTLDDMQIHFRRSAFVGLLFRGNDGVVSEGRQLFESSGRAMCSSMRVSRG